jgi:hypothetical protein
MSQRTLMPNERAGAREVAPSFGEGPPPHHDPRFIGT